MLFLSTIQSVSVFLGIIILFLISLTLIILLYLYCQHTSSQPVPTLIFDGNNLQKYILTIVTPEKQSIQKLILFSKKNKNKPQELDGCNEIIKIHGRTYNKAIFHINTEKYNEKIEYYLIDSNGKRFKSQYFFLRPLNMKNQDILRVSLFGDIQLQEYIGILESFMMFLVRKIGKPDLIICMGDLVHKSSDPKLWNVFFRMMRKLLPNTPFYTTPGNHCGGIDAGETIAKYFSRPQDQWNYQFVVKNTQFLTINSLNLRKNEGEKQLSWLKDHLSRPLDIGINKIFWTHFPFIGPSYASSGKATDYELYVKEKLHPILDENKVDFAFFGHKHAYIREGNKIVTASIHGVRKYQEIWTEEKKVKNRHHFCVLEIANDKLTMKAITWWGSLMDQVEILKQDKTEVQD